MAKTRDNNAPPPKGKKRKRSRIASLFRRCAVLLLGGGLAYSVGANYLENRSSQLAPETPQATEPTSIDVPIPRARPQSFAALPAASFDFNLPSINKYCFSSGYKIEAQTCIDTAASIFVVFPSWHAATESIYGDIDQIGKGIFKNAELVLRAAQMESNMGRNAVSLTVLKNGKTVVGSYKGPFQFAADEDSYLDDWAQKREVMMLIKDRIPVLAGYADLTEAIMQQEEVIKDPQASAAMFLTDMLIRHIRLERRFDVMSKYGRNVHMGLSYLGHLHQWAQLKAVTGFGCNMTWADYAKGLSDKTRETYETHFRSNPGMFGAHGQNRPADTILSFLSKTQRAATQLTDANGLPVIKADIAQSRRATACAAPKSRAPLVARTPVRAPSAAARPTKSVATTPLPQKRPNAG